MINNKQTNKQNLLHQLQMTITKEYKWNFQTFDQLLDFFFSCVYVHELEESQATFYGYVINMVISDISIKLQKQSRDNCIRQCINVTGFCRQNNSQLIFTSSGTLL